MNRIRKIGMDVHSTIYGIPGMAAGSAARDARPAGCGFPVTGAAGAENAPDIRNFYHVRRTLQYGNLSLWESKVTEGSDPDGG